MENSLVLFPCPVYGSVYKSQISRLLKIKINLGKQFFRVQHKIFI